MRRRPLGWRWGARPQVFAGRLGLIAVPPVVLAVVLAAMPVRAHLMETGFGGYYDGLAHLLLTPSDLLLVVALAVLAGQNGSRCSRWLLLTLGGAWLLGGLVGLQFPSEPELPWLLTLSFTLVGLLVALQLRAGAVGLSVLAGMLGMLHGVINGAAMNHGGGGGLALLGSVCGVVVLGTIIAGQTTVLQASWQRIALRVMGSWIAASGLLMLGWLARSTG